MQETTPLKRVSPPLHPGELLREYIPALGIPVAHVARHLNISRETLYQILKGAAPVTPAMALRLGKLCGNDPELWIIMQVKHDLHRLSQDMADEIAAIPTLGKDQP